MRSNWIRAWLATTALIAGATAVARNKTSWLLTVEEPVMDWLLDGTDTSRWDATAVISSPVLLIIGTIVMVALGAWLDWRIAVTVVITTVMGIVVTQLLQTIGGRVAPRPEFGTGSFPSMAVSQTGVFWGLIVLMCWWLGLPKLLWQIVVELAIVLTIVVSIRQILSGEIWPSDAIGSALVIGLSLITAALVFEANPASLPWKNRIRKRSTVNANSMS